MSLSIPNENISYRIINFEIHCGVKTTRFVGQKRKEELRRLKVRILIPKSSYLKERLVCVLAANVEVLDVGVAQTTAATLQEVECGQTASDVVVGLLSQGQQGRQVRLDALSVRNGKQTLGQPRRVRRREL